VLHKPIEANLLETTAFCVCFLGEFNAGKSTAINALAGQKLLETGHLPTTDAITVLTHPLQDEEELSYSKDSLIHIELVHPLLQDVTLVDTPGTNAILDHTARTMQLLPSADLLLFVTSAN
jgi:ribosome biogenesis GTPase A